MRAARRILVPLATALAAAAVLTPGLTRPVAATWRDAQYVGAPVRLASADCTDVGLYTASASAALLSGTVQGVQVTTGSSTAPLVVGPRRDAAALTGTLTQALAGTTPSVPGTTLPLALTSGGSWSQAARTSGSGASSAAVTGSSPLGVVDVSGLLGQAPAATSLLPGLTAVGVDVGVPTASASQDACAAGWGAANTLVRTSAVSGLALRFTADAITGGLDQLRSDGTSAGTALTSAATAATTPVAQATGAALLAAVRQALAGVGSLSLGASTAAIAPVVSAVPAAASSGQWGSGGVTVDAARGTTTVDLLPSGASGSGPDVETVTASAMSAGAASAGLALRQAGAAIATATASARDSAPVTVGSAVTVSLAGTPVVSIGLTTAATRADTWAASGAVPVVTVTVLSSSLLSGLPSNLQALVTTALGTMPTVGAVVSSEYLAKAPAPAATLTADADAAATALGTRLAAVPAVLSAVVGQRATSAASSWTGSLASGVTAGSALRLRVQDATGTRMDLFVGNTAVGPDRPAAQ